MMKQTQEKMVLSYLKRHGSITQMKAYHCLPEPVTRLAAVVGRINTPLKRVKSVIIWDGKKNYAKYLLIKK